MAGKRNYFLATCPLLVVDERVNLNGIRQVWPPARSNTPDFETSNRNAAVRAVEMGIHACTGVEHEHVFGLV